MCVFRTDGRGVATFGVDHFAGQRVIPPVFPITNGFDSLPTMWFGANASGLDSVETLSLIARHRIGVYGWQQGTGVDPKLSIGKGDINLATAATHLSDYLDSRSPNTGFNRTLVGVYRQIMICLRLFSAARLAADNAEYDGFWLRNTSTGDKCTFGMPWGSFDPIWNFSNSSAADFWVNELVN